MLIKRKKKEVVLPIWDREEEYQSLKKAHDEAQNNYLSYYGDDMEKKHALQTEWLNLKKLYDPLYVQREEWLRETGTHPKAEKKEGLSTETKVMIGVTTFSTIAPIAAEHWGLIMRNAKDVTSRAWNYLMKTFHK